MRFLPFCAALLTALPLLIALQFQAAHAQSVQASCIRNFDAFLVQFESSTAFQRDNTRFPLSTVRTDWTALPAPETVFHTINSPADPRYADAVFPDSARQAAIPLKQRIKKGSGARFVLFSKPGTGGALTFTFEMSAGCWQLIKFENALRNALHQESAGQGRKK